MQQLWHSCLAASPAARTCTASAACVGVHSSGVACTGAGSACSNPFTAQIQPLPDSCCSCCARLVSCLRQRLSIKLVAAKLGVPAGHADNMVNRLCCRAQSPDQPEHVCPTDAAQLRLSGSVSVAQSLLDKHQLQLTWYLGSSPRKGPAMKNCLHFASVTPVDNFCRSKSERSPDPASAACQRPPGLPNSPLATASASCPASARGRAAAHCSVAAADDMASLAIEKPCITTPCC